MFRKSKTHVLIWRLLWSPAVKIHITISIFPEEAQYLVVVGVVDVNRIWGTLEELPPAGSGGSEQHVGKAEPESNSHDQCEKKLLREHQA